MRTKLFMLGLIATVIFTACCNGEKIEGWNMAPLESVSAPFLKQPKHCIEFNGFYADREKMEVSTNMTDIKKSTAKSDFIRLLIGNSSVFINYSNFIYQ